MKLRPILLILVMFVLLTNGPWFSVYAQNCVQCFAGPPVMCIGGLQWGYVICSISGNSCVVATPCGTPPGGCFMAGTLVETLDGAVAIEDLHVGDRILGLSDDGEVAVNEVVETYRTLAVEFFIINDEISVTGTHPFLVGGDWIEAQDIRVGDILAGSGGTAVPVNSIQLVEHGVRVFNVSVSGDHTFFAGGILVHNKPPDPEG